VIDNMPSTDLCPSTDISSYIDGELDLRREAELDAHLSACTACKAEMTRQKQFLRCLDLSLKGEGDIELPADFTKRIIVGAESNVSGLRRPAEFFNAVFICVGILLFVLFASGPEAVGLTNIVDQTIAVGGIFVHLFYDLFLGIAVIIRGFATHIRLDVVMMIVLSIVLSSLTIFLSRRVLRVGRA
jgi:hypothetical protein